MIQNKDRNFNNKKIKISKVVLTIKRIAQNWDHKMPILQKISARNKDNQK